MASLGRRTAEAAILVAVLVALGWGLQRIAGVETAAKDVPVADPVGESEELKQDSREAIQTPLQTSIATKCTSPVAETDPATFEPMQRWKRLREDAIATLAQSADPEDVLVAALLARPGTDRNWQRTLIMKIDEAAHVHPVVPALMLDNCMRSSGACGPGMPAIENRLSELDGENGLAWALVAVSRDHRGDVTGALAALREAVAAASYDNYFVDMVRVSDTALATVTDLSSGIRFEYAFGVAALAPQYLLGVPGMCRRRAGGNDEWGSLCALLGERIAAEGRTMLSQQIGLELQQMTSELVGNTLEYRRLDELIDRRRQEQSSFLIAVRNLDSEKHEAIFREALEVWAAGNETDGMEFLAREAEVLWAEREDDSEVDCRAP